MCNFVFSDHSEVMDHLYKYLANNNEATKSEHLGIDERLRLKVEMGPG
jgi:hypothetical protein